MICDLCKVNSAVIHIEKHSGDSHTQLIVCCECAGLEGLSPENLSGEALQKLISGVNLIQKNNRETVCPGCGMDTDTFKNSGKLGCGKCYDSLRSSIDFSEWQKSAHFKHVGRTPFNFEVIPEEIEVNTEDLQTLEDKLVICISEEKYEEAALLRDRIEEMKKTVS